MVDTLINLKSGESKLLKLDELTSPTELEVELARPELSRKLMKKRNTNNNTYYKDKDGQIWFKSGFVQTYNKSERVYKK